MTTAGVNGRAPASDKIDGGVLKIAAVVVVGAIMAILDTTVVNVALQELTKQFETSLDTIQWVATGYMLALSAVIPITGWASERFGTKRLYMLAIVMFLLGSVLAGLAWNVESLIIFRVVQGLGGGMLMPAGMTIMTRAAGPQRVGRVMAILGVPMLLGPIFGPILGGYLVDAVSWRWIFYINVPIGLIALLLAWRMLPRDSAARPPRFDFPGLLMLSPGLALFIYGVSKIPSEGGVGAVGVWLPAAVGLVLIAVFIARALRVANPLINLRLFRDRTFSIAVATLAVFAIGFFGVMLLMPTYFILVRGESAMWAGILLAPQGLGAMLTMPIAGRLADRIGAGKVVLPGLLLVIAGLVPFSQIGADTAYWQLLLSLFVIGLGLGATMMPTMSAALQTLTHEQVSGASAATNIVQQTFGAVGSAVMSVILAASLAGKFDVPTNKGQLVATAAIMNPKTHTQAAIAAAESFGSTFVWGLILMAVCLLPALFLPRRRPARPESGSDESQPTPTLVH